FFDLAPRRGHGLSCAIGAIRGDGVERVGYGEHSRPEMNLLATQATWIAAAIEVLLVGVDDLGWFVQEGNLAQHLITKQTVFAHHCLLFASKAAGLTENCIRYRHLANVMQ